MMHLVWMFLIGLYSFLISCLSTALGEQFERSRYKVVEIADPWQLLCLFFKCPLDNFWHIYFSSPLFSWKGVICREYAVNNRRKHFDDSGKIIAVIRDVLHVVSGH